jgi:hypothetical protein
MIQADYGSTEPSAASSSVWTEGEARVLGAPEDDDTLTPVAADRISSLVPTETTASLKVVRRLRGVGRHELWGH